MLALFFPLEASPRLRIDARSSGDEERLWDWLASSDTLVDGVDLLLGLRDQLLDEREESEQ
jgi:hypothetical protein